MTDHARAARELLRDNGHFAWYVIPLLLLVIYVYAVEVERRNWNVADVPYLILLLGYAPFFVVAFAVHDMPRVRTKVVTVGAVLGLDAAALVLFGSLGWI